MKSSDFGAQRLGVQFISKYEKTYAKLMQWIEEKGYVVCGFPMEIYSKKPEVVNGVTVLYAKVMIPVNKK